MTSLSFEVPVQHLDDFDDLQDHLFVLSFLVHREAYTKYLREKRRNRVMILDNSFNELNEAQKPEEMRQAYDLIGPDYTISPDDDMWTESEMLRAYDSMLALRFLPSELILPVRSHEEYLSARRYGIKNLAVPYEYRPLFGSKMVWERVHFLGLRDPIELTAIEPISCDTSMPIKLALRGQTLRDWILECCPHIQTTPGFFDQRMSNEQIEFARQNILSLKELLK